MGLTRLVLRVVIGVCLVMAGAIHVFGLSVISTLAPVATSLIAVMATAIAFAAMRSNWRIARLRATLDLIEGSESKEYYQERYRAYRAFRRAPNAERERIADPSNTACDEVRSKCQDFLNHYELVAIAGGQGLIDLNFYRTWMGPTFVRDWNEAAILIRRARRPDGPGDAGSPDAYTQFERLALRWGGRSLPPS